MDARETAFVHEYIINGGNAYQAALKAGYKENTAERAKDWIENTPVNSGNKRHLPFKPYLVAAIDAEVKKIESDKIADATEVMQYLTSVMRREKMESVVVVTHQEVTKYVPNPETGRNVKQTVKKESPEVVEIPTKISDANKAAELLGKIHRIFSEKVELDMTPVVLAGYDDVPD